MPMASNFAALMKSTKSSKSACVSPGNPTIKFERMPASGDKARIWEIKCKNFSESPKRRILRKMVGLVC